MNKTSKQIAEEIDSHIHAMIEGLLELQDVGDSATKESLYPALCDFKRWTMVEWGQIHNMVGLGPFCVFKEKPEASATANVKRETKHDWR